VVQPERITLSKYMVIMFAGVKKWLGDEEKIRGVIGLNRESVNFRKAIVRGLIWHDLKAVHDELTKIVAW
jgi:hypothetical protein